MMLSRALSGMSLINPIICIAVLHEQTFAACHSNNMHEGYYLLSDLGRFTFHGGPTMLALANDGMES